MHAQLHCRSETTKSEVRPINNKKIRHPPTSLEDGRERISVWTRLQINQIESYTWGVSVHSDLERHLSLCSVLAFWKKASISVYKVLENGVVWRRHGCQIQYRYHNDYETRQKKH